MCVVIAWSNALRRKHRSFAANTRRTHLWHRASALVRLLRRNRRRRETSRTNGANRAMLSKWQRDLLAGVPAARIVELRRANLFMFLSNEADVLREVRTFVSALAAR